MQQHSLRVFTSESLPPTVVVPENIVAVVMEAEVPLQVAKLLFVSSTRSLSLRPTATATCRQKKVSNKVVSHLAIKSLSFNPLAHHLQQQTI